jgi:hypothetical protein
MFGEKARKIEELTEELRFIKSSNAWAKATVSQTAMMRDLYVKRIEQEHKEMGMKIALYESLLKQINVNVTLPASVAQLVEQDPCKVEVAGSMPVAGSNIRTGTDKLRTEEQRQESQKELRELKAWRTMCGFGTDHLPEGSH